MPTYTFKSKVTGEQWTEMISISERDNVLKDPTIEQVVSAPAIVSGVSAKPDSGFRDVLKHIKSSHRGSKINTY
jgi:hypothetical protein